jgi:H+/Cl- antiporter ClcA
MSNGVLQPNVTPFDALASFPVRFWLYIIIGIVASVSGGLLMKLFQAA